MRVLLDGCLADLHVAEVAVFEQVDRVDQLAVRVQAEGGDDLPRRQAEQPDPGPGHLPGVLPALERQRADVQRLPA